MRHDGVIELPKALCIGAITDQDYVEDWAAECAKGAQSVGINLILGPDADVNLNAKNPIINDRSFGDNPEQVSKQVVTVIKTLHDNGIYCCIKHFPGLGRSNKDSHSTLPSLKVSREELEQTDLAPFKAGIAVNVPCIMTGHIALSKTESIDTPASLSPYWIKKVLRNECKFKGVVVSDDLIMAGALLDKTIPEAAVSALQAGTDLCLIGREAEESIDAIVTAVQANELSEDVIDEHLDRLNLLKATLRAPPAGRSISFADTIKLNKKLYAKALTLVGDPIPLNLDNALIVHVGSTPLSPVLRRLVEHNPSLQIDALRKDPRDEDVDGILHDMKDKNELLLVLSDLERSPAASFGITKTLKAALDRLNQSGKTIRYVIFGSPYVLGYLPSPVTSALVAYEDTEGSCEAVYKVLIGKSRPEGKLPIQFEVR